MFFLKFLGIHCSLIKKHDFFVFLQNEGIFVATLDDKGGGGVGGSDFNIILTLSLAT